MADFEPAPTWANPVLMEKDPKTNENKATFNPVWLKWFLDLTALLSGTPTGGSGGGGGGGLGYVVGPASAANGNIVLFDGTTGKLIKDSGVFLWTFVDLETPTGLVDGFNAVFTLANNPQPVESLQLFLSDGLGTNIAYVQGIDYTVSGGNTVTFGTPPAPAGAGLRAFYRHI